MPLKFNVYVNGIEKTNTDGLSVTQQVIPCDASAPQDPVEPAAVTEQDGLALTARFKVR